MRESESQVARNRAGSDSTDSKNPGRTLEFFRRGGFEGCPRQRGGFRIPRAIDNGSDLDLQKIPATKKADARERVHFAISHGCDFRVKQHIQSWCLGDELIGDKRQRVRAVGQHIQTAHAHRWPRAATGEKAFRKFHRQAGIGEFEGFALVVSKCVETAHRVNKGGECHAAETAPALDEQGFRTRSGGSNGGSDTGGSAPRHENFAGEVPHGAPSPVRSWSNRSRMRVISDSLAAASRHEKVAFSRPRKSPIKIPVPGGAETAGIW